MTTEPNIIEGRNWRVIVADVMDGLRSLPDESVHCCVTSPPYFGLRDYGVEGQIGLEKTPAEFVAKMVAVFHEVHRVLRKDGTCWVNMGDSYAAHDGQRKVTDTTNSPKQQSNPGSVSIGSRSAAGFKPKDLMGMPWRLAFALQADGWWLRQDIIWAKKNTMPESVTDRCTKSHEYVFLLTKSAKYFYDAKAVEERCSESTHARLSQDVAAQVGSERANGGAKTNGTMKAVYAGSTRKLADAGSGTKNNGSFDAAMAIMPDTRNLRSVWTFASEGFSDWKETVSWSVRQRDEVSGGMKHRVSPSCPVHAGLLGPAAKTPCDERAASESLRSSGNDGRLASEPESDCDLFGKPRGGCSPQHSSDSPDQNSVPTAKSRSNRKSKKDRVLSTSPSCTPSEETPGHIEHTQAESSCSDSAERKHGSNTSADSALDDQDSDLSERTTDRIVDRQTLPIPPECLCTFYERVTSKTSHFATFPSELPRRCIKAGTSEKGCCSACGAPWVRTKERTSQKKYEYETIGIPGDGKNRGRRTESCGTSQFKATGWEPSCDCGLWVCPSGCNLIESVSSTFHGNDADENSLQEEMRGVQKELRDRGQSQDMLRTDVRSQDVVNEFKGTETASVEGEAKEVQGVRNRVQAGSIENAILRQGVLAKTHDQTPEECKGVVQERQGIHPGLHANPSASNEPGLCNATPACDGNVSKAIAATGRSGSSQKRAKRRQSAREPGSDAHAATQQASEGQEANNDQVPLLQRHAPVIKCCPRCGENCEWIPRPTEPCTVLDIFSGSGTTGMVATELGRQYIGIELNPAYAELSRKRIESWKYRSVEKQLEPLAGQKELF